MCAALAYLDVLKRWTRELFFNQLLVNNFFSNFDSRTFSTSINGKWEAKNKVGTEKKQQRKKEVEETQLDVACTHFADCTSVKLWLYLCHTFSNILWAFHFGSFSTHSLSLSVSPLLHPSSIDVSLLFFLLVFAEYMVPVSFF